MTTIYVAHPSGNIETKEALKETPKQYLVEGGSYRKKPARLNKESYDHKIFTTLPEAQAWCIVQMQEKANLLTMRLDRLRSDIAKLQAEMEANRDQ